MTTSSYIHHTSQLISNTSISSSTFRLIGGLDEAVTRLAAIVDLKLSKLTSNSSESDIDDIRKLSKIIEELTDRKIQLTIKNYDLIDHNMKIVDQKINLVENLLNSHPNSIKHEDGDVKDNEANKKRKLIALGNNTDQAATVVEDFLIDPNEPVYCICKQVAYGDMIACDNDECEIEWFHYPCVNLTKKPRSTWMCAACISKCTKSGS